MSLPIIKSSSHDECTDLYSASNTTIEDGTQHLSDNPSEMSFVIELPPEQTSIHFSVNPSVRKFAAKCYKCGSRTVVMANCKRSRKNNVLSDYQSSSRDFSQTSSVTSADYDSCKHLDNTTLEAQHMCNESVSKTDMIRSDQQSIKGIRSRNSVAASISIENLTPNLNTNYCKMSVLELESSKKLADEIPKVDSVPCEFLLSPDWVEETRENIGNVAAYSVEASQMENNLISEKSEICSSNEIKCVKIESALFEENPITLETVGKELIAVAKESTILKENRRCMSKNSAATGNLVHINETPSGELAKMMLHAINGRKGMILLLSREPEEEIASMELVAEPHLQESEDDILAIKGLLDDGSKLNSSAMDVERSISTKHSEEFNSQGQSGISKAENSVSSNEPALECKQQSVSGFVTTESSNLNENSMPEETISPVHADTEKTSTKNKVASKSKKIKQLKPSTKRTKKSPVSLKSSQNNQENVIDGKKMPFDLLRRLRKYINGVLRLTHEVKNMPREEVDESFRANFNKLAEVLIDPNTFKEKFINDIGDLAPSLNESPSHTSISDSSISIASTYDLEPKTSRWLENSVTMAETSDYVDFSGESEIVNPRANKYNFSRKKKASLYSETQSKANDSGAGGSAAASGHATTEGDGATIPRGPRNTAARFGKNSMEYYLKWDTDGFEQQEYFYNGNDAGAKEELNKPSSRKGLRQQNIHQKNQKKYKEFEDEVNDEEVEKSSININGKCQHKYKECFPKKDSIQQCSESVVIYDKRPRIYESRSNEYVDSLQYLSQSRSFEQNSSSITNVNVSNTSATVYTLYTQNPSPISENLQQSDQVCYPDRSCQVIFSPGLRSSLQDSSSGLVSNSNYDSPKKMSREQLVTICRPGLCESDYKFGRSNRRKKHHRFTAHARQYLDIVDAASTESEECMSVDQFDVTNSSIVLRKKRRKSAGGLTFLRVRKTHPCRNLPRLLLKQDVKQSLSVSCAVDSSESNIFKEIDLEGAKDYSDSFRIRNSNNMKLSQPKWVKSLDSLFGFAHYIPKITRVANEKCDITKLVKDTDHKPSKSLTDLTSEETSKQAAAIDKSPVRAKKDKEGCKDDSRKSKNGHHKNEVSAVCEKFRSDRKKKYNLVKVPDITETMSNITSDSSRVNSSAMMRVKENNCEKKVENISKIARFSKFSHHSKENSENDKGLRVKAGVTGNDSTSKNKNVASHGKGTLKTFLGCVTKKASDNEKSTKTDRIRQSSVIRKEIDKNNIKTVVANEGGKSKRSHMYSREETDHKTREKTMPHENTNRSLGYDNNRKGADNKKTPKIAMPFEDVNSTRDYVSSRKETDKMTGENGMSNENKNNWCDFTDIRKETDNKTTTKIAVPVEDGKNASDCVEKVSFEDAYSSIRSKKGAIAEYADDGWITDDSMSSRVSILGNKLSHESVVHKRKEHEATLIQKDEKQADEKNNKYYRAGLNNSKNQLDDVNSSKHQVVEVKRSASPANHLKRNSGGLNSNSESKRSDLQCHTFAGFKSSSKYLSDVAQSNGKQTDVLKNSRFESDSLKSNLNAAEVKKDKAYAVENTIAETSTVNGEPESCFKSRRDARVQDGATKKTTGRLRAAEYDRKNLQFLKQKKYDKQKQRESKQFSFESEICPESERYVNTGQAKTIERPKSVR